MVLQPCMDSLLLVCVPICCYHWFCHHCLQSIKEPVTLLVAACKPFHICNLAHLRSISSGCTDANNGLRWKH